MAQVKIIRKALTVACVIAMLSAAGVVSAAAAPGGYVVSSITPLGNGPDIPVGDLSVDVIEIEETGEDVWMITDNKGNEKPEDDEESKADIDVDSLTGTVKIGGKLYKIKLARSKK